jgi:hypothetical protein
VVKKHTYINLKNRCAREHPSRFVVPNEVVERFHSYVIFGRFQAPFSVRHPAVLIEIAMVFLVTLGTF